MPLTILVAEDDLGTRLSICDYLEAGGYLVVMAENGQEALKRVEQYQPHLIITDVTMPQMDGYGFIKELRKRPSLRLLPVILLTARTETQARVRGYELGCDVYLAKPFELQELGAVVRNLLERQQMLESERRFVSDKVAETAAANRAAIALPLAETAEGQRRGTIMTSPALLNLTQREQDVLSVLADGLSNVQIGEHLHLSPRTVEKYVSSLLKKTETNNRAELVRFAMDNHLVE